MLVSFARGESRGSQEVRRFLEHGPKPGCGLGPGVMSLREGNDHSSTLAWKIPWTEEPGWLQPMGSRRVRHD